MEWLSTTIEKLQAGDIQTAVIVLIALLVGFFILKILMNTIKAIIVIAAIIIIVTIFFPNLNIIENVQQISADAINFIQDKIGGITS